MKLESTKTTPQVDFDLQSQRFCITGNSTPIDALAFYKTLTAWIDENEGQVQAGANFIFHVPYFNSASNKGIFLLLKRIKELQEKTGPLHIQWSVMDDDEFMRESGEAYEELLDLKLEYVDSKNVSISDNTLR